jgi:hypothetical protein
MERAAEGPKKLNVLYGSRHIRSTRSGDGISLLIAAVGLRLVFIAPHLEQGDHLRHRQMSAIMRMGSSLPAIAPSFVDPRLALWALVLNFAGPLLRRRWHRAVVLD